MNLRNAIFVSLAILILCGTMSAFGAIRTVDDNGPADFASIQAAIADVGTVGGDEIVVQPGTYIEAIDFLGKAVTLRSASGNPADTIINGNGAYHVVQFVNGEGLDSVIDGFTITGGNANGSSFDSHGSGIFINECGPTITNCVLTANNATNGTLSSYIGSPDISYCVFSNNTVKIGGGIYMVNGNPVVSHCDFVNNQAENGGGMNINSSNLTISDCTFTANSASGNIYGTYGGGIMNSSVSSTMTVERCIFIGNDAMYGGGLWNQGGSVNVIDCKFFDNYGISGGGIYNGGAIDMAVTQCIFSGNSSSQGGGIYNTASTPEITSCVFYGNTASVYGGGIYGSSNSSSTITNSIFWNNGIDDIYGYHDGTNRSLISFCNLEEGFTYFDGIDGGGNIGSSPYFYGSDPFFLDPDGPDNIVGTEDDDFRLMFGSPSVDAGNNFAVNLPQTDLDGIPRILNGVVDMGPYERADCDGNGSIDADSDLDGTPDECDVCPGFDDFLDTDSDTIPDGCDTCFGDDSTGDTDGDGVCDDLDACPGFDDSIDDDNDGVIDGCDLCFGDNATLDKDADGICEDLDICPYADDNGPDSDNDGIPDACDDCSLIGDSNCDGIVDLLDLALLALHWLETI